MEKQTKNAAKSLYISLFLVGTFVVAIVAMQLPRVDQRLSNSDNALAGSQEAVDSTAVPIGGSEEIVEVATARPTATVRASATVRPTLKPVETATPSASPAPTIAATETPVQPETPVPTFNLNLPGDTTGVVPTNPPVATTKQSNNLPILIGVIVGVLLIAGGVILVLVRRKAQSDDFTPPSSITPPPQTPPTPFQAPGANQPDQTQGGYNTPYDQYMNNPPNNPQQ